MSKVLQSILDFVARVMTPGTVAVVAFLIVVLTLSEGHKYAIADKIVSLVFGNYLLFGIIIAMAVIIWHLHSKLKEITRLLESENKRLVKENESLKVDLRQYTRKTLDIQEQKVE